MKNRRYFRFLFSQVLSFCLIFAPVVQAKVPGDVDPVSYFAAKEFVARYSRLKDIHELKKFFSRGRSLADQRDIADMFAKISPTEKLPKMEMRGSKVLLTVLGESIEIEMSSIGEKTVVIDGTKFTLDPAAPFKMQTEILIRKLEEGKKPHGKFSWISLLVPEAHAGPISGLRKGANAAARARKAAALAEAKAAAAGSVVAKKEATKNFWKGILVNGTIMGTYEFIRGGALNASLQWVCEKKEKWGMIEPTPDGINEASLCKQYLKDRKLTIDQKKAEEDKKKAEKDKVIKDDKVLGAAGAIEALQKDEVAGMDLYAGAKLCPYENKDRLYRSTLTVITENPKTKVKESTLQLVEAKFDGSKLKEIQCFEATANGKGKLIATYTTDGENLDVIKIPNKKYDPHSPNPGSPEVEIKATTDLSADPEMDADKKYHKQIYSKILLGIGACVDEEKNKAGKEASKNAVQRPKSKGSSKAASGAK